MQCFRFLAFTLLALSFTCSISVADDRPNIVWIVVEDMSLPFGCYGETTIETPNVDQLAAQGVKFTRAYVTAPVCSTARSALVTGMYQTSIGAHHHRSGRGKAKIQLPKHIRVIPELFRKSGYHTSNSARATYVADSKKAAGKTDYNFQWDASAYDGYHWKMREKGQPFFAQFQLRGGKARTDKTPKPVDPKDVKLPVYYPRDEVILQDWALYLNSAMNTDIEVGQIVKDLKDEGVLDNTYIFFITDHGISHARGKQFMYEEGTRIPLVVRGPGLTAGEVRDDLCVHIDLAASSLSFAGIDIPKWMESVDLFDEDYQRRDYIISARDRCDETVDHMRSVRTENFKYIRNFLPKRPYLQPNAYKDNKSIVMRMRELYAAGKLDAAQAKILAESRPQEELYDLVADPNELTNLASQPKHQKQLIHLRATLDKWVEKSQDAGRAGESDSMYDSDMKVYLDTIKIRRPERAAEIQSNIDLMKKWQSLQQ